MSRLRLKWTADYEGIYFVAEGSKKPICGTVPICPTDVPGEGTRAAMQHAILDGFHALHLQGKSNTMDVTVEMEPLLDVLYLGTSDRDKEVLAVISAAFKSVKRS
jgi:hypothetical protein